MWDVIVVGTGMGGGMLGYSLARSGRRVLFVEKGRSTLPGAPGTIRSSMPEVAEPLACRSAEAYYDVLARAGRSTDEIEDISGRFSRRYRAGHRQRDRRVDRPSTAWSASDSSFAISPPGRTSATPAIPPCQMPGRSPTTRCGPGTPQAEKLLRGSRPARSPAAGGRRGRSACGATVFGRQPAAGRLSDRSRIASLPPADGL